MDHYRGLSVNRSCSGPWTRRCTADMAPLDDTVRKTTRGGKQGSGDEVTTSDGQRRKDSGGPYVDSAGRALDGLDSEAGGTLTTQQGSGKSTIQAADSGSEGIDRTGRAAKSDDEFKPMTNTNDIDPLFLEINGEEQKAKEEEDTSAGTLSSREGSVNGELSSHGEALDTHAVENKLDIMSALLKKMDVKSDKLAETVTELQVSLEYSQSEIDLLKGENSKLKQTWKQKSAEPRSIRRGLRRKLTGLTRQARKRI